MGNPFIRLPNYRPNNSKNLRLFLAQKNSRRLPSHCLIPLHRDCEMLKESIMTHWRINAPRNLQNRNPMMIYSPRAQLAANNGAKGIKTGIPLSPQWRRIYAHHLLTKIFPLHPNSKLPREQDLIYLRMLMIQSALGSANIMPSSRKQI